MNVEIRRPSIHGLGHDENSTLFLTCEGNLSGNKWYMFIKVIEGLQLLNLFITFLHYYARLIIYDALLHQYDV